jgi:hypothetical protein
LIDLTINLSLIWHLIKDELGKKMPKQLTNDEIDNILKQDNRLIERIGNYQASSIPLEWKCIANFDHKNWKACTNSVLGKQKTGCPKCGRKRANEKLQRLTNEEIDSRLEGRNIARDGDVVNANTPMGWICTVNNCNYKWRTTPSSVVIRGSGCKKCAKLLRLTDEEMDRRLIGRPVKRIGHIIDAKTPTEFQCVDCSRIYLATPNNISSGKNCRICYINNSRWTNEAIDKAIVNRPITRLGDAINSKIPIDWRCDDPKCNSVWNSTIPTAIISECGCPFCSLGKNEKIVVSLLRENEISFEWHKDIRDIVSDAQYKSVDFYLASIKTIIEYNGIQHYRPTCFGSMNQETAEARFVLQQERDIYLEQFCNQNGIRLIWIDGRKYTNSKLHKYMIEDIIPQLNQC